MDRFRKGRDKNEKFFLIPLFQSAVMNEVNFTASKEGGGDFINVKKVKKKNLLYIL